MAEHDTGAIAREAHTLKSAAWTIGAERLHRTVQRLEKNAREGETDALKVSFSQVKKEYEELLNARKEERAPA